MLGTKQVFQAAAIGVGATAVMDGAAAVLRRTVGWRSLDYALVGRWLGHLPAGRWCHRDIRAAEPVARERELGWAAHYAIGAGFAVAFAAARPSWLTRPSLGPAVAYGAATVAAPWLVMQPAFGIGVAAARTPQPTQARLHSLRVHATYGVGLWLAARAAAAWRARRR